MNAHDTGIKTGQILSGKALDLAFKYEKAVEYQKSYDCVGYAPLHKWLLAETTWPYSI